MAPALLLRLDMLPVAPDRVVLQIETATAVHEEVVTLSADPDVEERFEVLEVLVVGAEQRFNPFFGDGNAFH